MHVLPTYLPTYIDLLRQGALHPPESPKTSGATDRAAQETAGPTLSQTLASTFSSLATPSKRLPMHCLRRKGPPSPHSHDHRRTAWTSLSPADTRRELPRETQPTQANSKEAHKNTGHCQPLGKTNRPAGRKHAYPGRNQRVSQMRALWHQCPQTHQRCSISSLCPRPMH